MTKQMAKKKINGKIEREKSRMEKRRMREAKKVDKAKAKQEGRMVKIKQKEVRLAGKLDNIEGKKKRKEDKKKEKIRKKEEKISSKNVDVKKSGQNKGVGGEISVVGKKRRRIIGPRVKGVVIFIIALLLLIVSSFLIYRGMISTLVVFLSLILIFFVYLVVRKRLKRYSDIKKMEDAFPDFISLMASNLRAGLTIDKALLLSSRKEFAPLDVEISNLGKDIMTGKEINKALIDMTDRIGSEDIRKTVMLIVSGIRSGGNLGVLLEQVSSNMRERSFVRKKAASNVLMYVIFIFFAVAFGAPILFGLSSVLVGVLTEMVSNVPADQVTAINVPFVLTKVDVSVTFILYFSLLFIVATDVFASFVLGLVSKGQERDGVKYIVPLILISVTVFFLSRTIVLKYFSGFLG